jgi:RHS repeat-associated protein
VAYDPTGPVSGLTLGNGLVEQWTFGTAQKQPTRLVAAATQPDLSYKVNDTWTWGYNGATANNGNIVSATVYKTDWTGAVPVNASQSFGYDLVNRLTGSSESGVWTRNYGYDAWANGWVTANSGLPLNPFTPVASSNFDANNRLGIQNSAYNTGGNQTAIGGFGNLYDAENRLLTSTIGGVTTTYSYDGDGRRVSKVTGATQSNYVYDAAGQLAAEYTSAAAQASACGTCYLTGDALGSTRMITDETATRRECHDYLPFGEEIPRAAGCYATTTSNTLKFTGKERDGETGLDYFGARYDSSAQGRFTSPDPITATPLHLINPQRWNMYSYAVSNPLLYVDPDGRAAIAVNFEKEVPVGGHEGIISLHADGRAEYARYGPVGGGKPYGEGQVDVYPLGTVRFGPDGRPTEAAYYDLEQQVAGYEHQNPTTVRMNYFKTTEAETQALDSWIQLIKKKAPYYNVTDQNCAVFTIVGLLQANAIKNGNISLVPNTLFNLLFGRATENYAWGHKQDPEGRPKKKKGKRLIPRANSSGSDNDGDD